MEQVSINSVRLETADIVLFGNGNIISRVIKWFSYRNAESNDQVHHSGTISKGGPLTGYLRKGAEIVESWAKVIESMFLYRGFYPGARIEVWRSKNISDTEKEQIGAFLKRNRGRNYGFKYIPLYGLDLLLSKILNRRVFYFRSKIRDPYNVICSVLTLLEYFNLGYTFGLPSPYYATPEYLQTWMEANPDKWELVYVLRNVKIANKSVLKAYVPDRRD